MIDATGMPQRAVVIGGTSDLARAICRALAARRLRHVVLAGRDRAAMGAVADELRSAGVEEVVTAAYDVTDVHAHLKLVEAAAAALGQVDLVLVAAGTLGDQEVAEQDPEETARVLDTNLTGPAAALAAFAALLRKQGQGRLVVLSSVAGVRVRRANFVYGASKAGLDAFALGLADAMAGSGAGVTVVRPGWVATRMTAGRQPAPFATTAEAVASDVVAGLAKGARVVWSPPVLRPVFGVLRLLPQPIWRRMPG